MDEKDCDTIPYEVGKNKRVTLVILSEAKDLWFFGVKWSNRWQSGQECPDYRRER